MIFAIPYILFFLLFLVLAVIVQQRKEDVALCRKIEYGAICLFFLFFGFRGFIWHDWTIYYPHFMDCEWGDFLEYDYFESREPGWLLLQLLCKSVVENYQFLVLVTTAINTAFLIRFFRRYSYNLLLGLAIYLVFSGFVLSINLMRNSLAILLFINALPYVEERRFWPFLGICLLASMFHLSALTFIPLYFILNLHINKYIFAGVILAAHVLLFVRFSPILELAGTFLGDNEIIASKLASYEEYGKRAGSRFVILFRLITCALVFCYYERIQEQNKHNHLFINSLMCYIVGMYLTAEFTEVSNRVGIIFDYCHWILWMYLLKSFRYSGNQLLYFGYSLFYFVFYISICIFQPVCSYQNYLLGNCGSYEENLANFNKTFKEPE